MYVVTQDFIDKMRADKRHVDAKITIDYTNWEIDQSILVESSEQTNVSYPAQTADGVAQATHKWASLDGSWVLDGSYRLAPEPQDLTRFQFGWWSNQLAGADGTFSAPYPSLTVTHIPRPVHSLRVVGDSARGEYPVDFRIDLYAQDGTLLRSEVVTGNAAVEWSMTLPTPVLDVAQQELVITRWSHPGRQAKIVEFFTSIQETYYSGDVVEVRLLEEREASQGSLPVGNISANEISIRLANEGKKFDVTNRQSPLWGLLKPNRRIRAWLGALAENQDSENPPTFTRNSVAYLSNGQQVAANVPRFETVSGRMGVMVEEGTTNLWTNTNGRPQTLTPGGTTPPTVELVPMQTPFGTQAWKVTIPAGNAAGFAGCRATTNSSTVSLVADGRKYSYFTYVYFPDGDPNGITIYPTGSWGMANCVRNASKDIGNWLYYENTYSITGGWSGTDYMAYYANKMFSTPKVFYIAVIQIEEKVYPTSFINGTRSPESLTIPTAGILDPNEGTIELWIKPSVVANYNNFFDMSTSNGRFLLFFTSAGFALFDYGPINTGPRSPNGSIKANQWHHIVLRWSAASGKQALFVDGMKYEQNLPNGVAASFPGRVSIVDNYSAYIDDLRISRRARTDEEIAAAYAAGKLEKDEDTTYLLTMNGSIYPVEQVWVPLGTFWSLDWDSPDDAMEATVTARDRMELLRKRTYQPGSVQQNVSLYTLAEQVLVDAGLKSGEYAIDTALQSIVVPWAWLSPTSHREALRIIAEAGLAVVYADRDGVVRVENLGSVPDTPVAEITEDDYFPPLQAPSRQDQVANEIVVTTQPLKPADTASEVYRSTTPISVPAGQTVTVTVQYTQVPVIQASASLDAPPAGVSITAATYYAWGAEVSIRNTSSTPANVTLVITGKPLSVQGGEQVIARDQTSIIENGVLRYEYPANPLVQTLAQAQAIASALLASAKDPRRDIEVEWRGNPALELGDRVTVVGQDVHVIRQEITWAGAMSARLTGRKVT